MEPIYAVYPGFVGSKTDKDTHFISAGNLCRLYGVKLTDCMIVKEEYYRDPSLREYLARADKLIALFPRHSGDYTLPTGTR